MFWHQLFQPNQNRSNFEYEEGMGAERVFEEIWVRFYGLGVFLVGDIFDWYVII